jgi:hypothetical protein
VPGERYRVLVRLNHVGQVFPRGNRIRVSISTSYWPLVWPPPEPVRLRIHPQSSALWLPVRAPRDDDALIAFPKPEATPGIAATRLEAPRHNWLVHRDLARHESTLEVIKDEGIYRIEEIDLEVGDRTWDWYTCRDDGRGSVRGETRTERSFARGAWRVRTTTRTVLTADRDNFYIHAELDGWENDPRAYSRDPRAYSRDQRAYSRDRRIYSRNWASTIPRKLV